MEDFTTVAEMSYKEPSFEYDGEIGHYGVQDATITQTHAGRSNFDMVESNQLARGLKSRHIQYCA